MGSPKCTKAHNYQPLLQRLSRLLGSWRTPNLKQSVVPRKIHTLIIRATRLLASTLEQGKCAEGHNPRDDLIAGSSPPYHYSYHCTLKSKSGLKNPLPVKWIFNILEGNIREGRRMSFTMYRGSCVPCKTDRRVCPHRLYTPHSGETSVISNHPWNRVHLEKLILAHLPM